jgi:hypothetical protein
MLKQAAIIVKGRTPPRNSGFAVKAPSCALANWPVKSLPHEKRCEPRNLIRKGQEHGRETGESGEEEDRRAQPVLRE